MLICLIIICCIIIGVFSLSQEIRERAISITDLKTNQSNIERIFLWKIALDMVSDHPFSGIGFGEWENRISEYSKQYANEWTFTQAAVCHPHNLYLSVAAETGGVGLLLFAGFWGYILILLFQRYRQTQDGFVKALSLGTAFSLLTLLTGGFFEDNLFLLVNMSLITFLIALSLFVDLAPSHSENTKNNG
jgi:O-antigen ligase